MKNVERKQERRARRVAATRKSLKMREARGWKRVQLELPPGLYAAVAERQRREWISTWTGAARKALGEWSGWEGGLAAARPAGDAERARR